MQLSKLFLKLGGLAGLASALTFSPEYEHSAVEMNGITFTRLKHCDSEITLEFTSNSGICETTPGVDTYSGYIHVGKNMSMWFMFFEARKNPEKAPLALWLNGGPGCSSMEGVFQENGPCYFVDDDATTPVNNPYSWNEYANMLYVDQPISVGFSYGTDTADSSTSAAPFVWKLLQGFYANFPKYRNRDFGLFTESYGGHMGPGLVNYFLEKNKAIESGCSQDIKIPVVALGINNGVFEPTTMYGTYADFAYGNNYVRMINDTIRDQNTQNYTTFCAPALAKCAKTATNKDCSDAEQACLNNVEEPLLDIFNDSGRNWYDIRQPVTNLGLIPPQNSWINYISNNTIAKKMGAQADFVFCSDIASDLFDGTGDIARSPIPALNNIVNSGVQTLIWAGDTDWIANWWGALASAEMIEYPGQKEFGNTKLQNYTVNGVIHGTYKGAGRLTFMRLFESGHQVPYYQRETALQVFMQTMQKKRIFST